MNSELYIYFLFLGFKFQKISIYFILFSKHIIIKNIYHKNTRVFLGRYSRRHNTIRQLLSTGVISLDFVKSKDNIVDPLTKGLNIELVEKSSRGMGLKPIKG